MRRNIPVIGLFIALGLILSYIESLLPLPFGVPGMKLGLCNVLVVLLLYLDSPQDALLVNGLRILLAGFLFGNLFSIAYSLAGAAVSFIAMCVVKKTGAFTMTTASVMGGIFHNFGQLATAAVLLSADLFWYAPVLIACGAVTGVLIGITATELAERLRWMFAGVKERG